jgi:HAD superfamily hydrolase (TIGR01509 family)
VPLLLCDLDDTLIDRAGAFKRWARDFAERRGIDAEHIPWMLDLDNDGHVARSDYLAALRERFRLPETVEQLSAEYHEVYPDFVAPPEADTVSALRRLREAGWRVGVVTNGAPSQEAKLARAGLVDLLDGWCVSDLVGHRKPDPEIFRMAACRCGAPLEGGWMVGDHGPADIAGASALGMASVWLRRGRAWPFAGYGPTHQADSFAEAAALIQCAAQAG